MPNMFFLHQLDQASQVQVQKHLASPPWWPGRDLTPWNPHGPPGDLGLRYSHGHSVIGCCAPKVGHENWDPTWIFVGKFLYYTVILPIIEKITCLFVKNLYIGKMCSHLCCKSWSLPIIPRLCCDKRRTCGSSTGACHVILSPRFQRLKRAPCVCFAFLLEFL